MSVHFVSNAIRDVVKYLNYARSFKFPCKFMPYFRLFLVSCWIGMYVGVFVRIILV